MAEANALEEIEKYPWPEMADPTRVHRVSARAQKLAEENHYAILAPPWLLFPFERAFAMQGMDRFLGNMIRYPEFRESAAARTRGVCRSRRQRRQQRRRVSFLAGRRGGVPR